MTTTHRQPTTAYHQELNVSNISAVTDPIWNKIKVTFLGPSLTDVKYHGDICPCNVCPGTYVHISNIGLEQGGLNLDHIYMLCNKVQPHTAQISQHGVDMDSV